MSALIPIPSTSCDNENAICLLDPAQLFSRYGIDGLTTIVQVKVWIEAGDDWWIGLEEEGSRATLLDPTYYAVEQTGTIDVIATLGHQITILPGQRLIFQSDSWARPCISYISLDTQ